MVDNHIPARGILDMFPGLGRETYPGGRGMGCDYNIIVHLEKFSQFALSKAYFNCKFCENSPEVAKWVIMIMFSPRAKHDHNHPLGEFRFFPLGIWAVLGQNKVKFF